MTEKRTRLGIFVSHPIQYFAPLWRELARHEAIDLRVHFFSEVGLSETLDPGFGVQVSWDVPLLEGYESVFLQRADALLPPQALRMCGPEQVLREGAFDVVLIHGYMYGFERQLLRIAERLNVRILMRGELTDRLRPGHRRGLRRLARRLQLRKRYSRVDAFCAIGNECVQHLESHGVPKDRIYWSPYSVDADLIDSQGSRWDRRSARAELGIPEDAFVVLFSGKFISRKAPLVLARALHLATTRDRIWTIFLGSGELDAQVRGAAEGANPGRVLFPGFVNQTKLGLYFKAADAFVLPSVFETWGLVVNEAMHYGLPAVVSTGVGSRWDLVKEGETGHVFPVGDAPRLAQLLDSLARDRKATALMGRAAKQLVDAYRPAASAEGIARAAAGVKGVT